MSNALVGKHIIFVGPKKTGTSSIYRSLKTANIQTHVLWPKESNRLLRSGYKSFTSSDRPVIDVSPAYFSSFRAIAGLLILRESGVDFTVIVLKRDPNKRLRSHIGYMLHKQEVSSSFIEPEWENIFISELNLWQNWNGLDIRILSLTEAYDLVDYCLNLTLDRKSRENVGGYVPRFNLLFKAVRIVAKILRKNDALARFLERIVPFVRRGIYQSGSDNSELVNNLASRVNSIMKNFIHYK